MTRRILAPVVLGAASVLALAGCAGGAPPATSPESAAGGKVAGVASTDVHGSIAPAIGGEVFAAPPAVPSSPPRPDRVETHVAG